MSRVIIACQEGGRRSEIAAEMVTGMGYTAIAVVEGGVDEYLKVSPLKEADLRPRVKRVQQEVGIKYGGTGVSACPSLSLFLSSLLCSFRRFHVC